MAVMSVMYSITFIPFSLVDTKCEKDRFCFRNLKNTSISQRLLYASATCFGVRPKSLVIRNTSFSTLLTLPLFAGRVVSRGCLKRAFITRYGVSQYFFSSLSYRCTILSSYSSRLPRSVSVSSFMRLSTTSMLRLVFILPTNLPSHSFMALKLSRELSPRSITYKFVCLLSFLTSLSTTFGMAMSSLRYTALLNTSASLTAKPSYAMVYFICLRGCLPSPGFLPTVKPALSLLQHSATMELSTRIRYRCWISSSVYSLEKRPYIIYASSG